MRSKLARFCREPLVHFLVLGAGLFLLWHFLGDKGTSQSERILITPGQVERLTQQWTRTHLRPPTREELAGLVEQEIDEEILQREAVALGLDRDDAVIRRRLAVKMEFLTEDFTELATPTDEQLQRYLDQHPDRFTSEVLTTFSQVYLNRSQRGVGAATEAERLLALLNEKPDSDWRTLGDSLPLPQDYEDATAVDVARQFGREFPKRLAGLPVGRWSGSVESTYGLHLVLVRKRTPARIPPLGEVRDAVLREWRAAQREELKENLCRSRRAKYAVTVQWPDWVKEAR